MSPDDPQPVDGRSSGASAGSGARNPRVQVFEARMDGRGAWRLDEPSAAHGWLASIKKFLLVAVSLAVAVALWIFAFALLLVLLPLAVVAGWWMWRRLQALRAANPARRNGAGPF